MRPLHVVGAAILAGGRCLVTQRGHAMALAGKWEFPGGKVEPGEDPRAALAREVREELGLDILVAELLGTGHAAARDRLVRLDVYAAEAVAGELRLGEHAASRWLGPEELSSLDWAEADVPIVPLVAARLRSPSALRPGDGEV